MNQSVTLALKEYVGPDCPCGLEGRLRALHSVHDVHIALLLRGVDLGGQERPLRAKHSKKAKVISG